MIGQVLTKLELAATATTLFVAWLLFYITTKIFPVFAVAMPNKSYFDEFPIWKMVVQSVDSKFSRIAEDLQ